MVFHAYGHLKSRPDIQDNGGKFANFVSRNPTFTFHRPQGDWRRYPFPPPRMKEKSPHKHKIKGGHQFPRAGSLNTPNLREIR